MEIAKGVMLFLVIVWLLVEGVYILNGEDRGLIDWILRKLGL